LSSSAAFKNQTLLKICCFYDLRFEEINGHEWYFRERIYQRFIYSQGFYISPVNRVIFRLKPKNSKRIFFEITFCGLEDSMFDIRGQVTEIKICRTLMNCKKSCNSKPFPKKSRSFVYTKSAS